LWLDNNNEWLTLDKSCKLQLLHAQKWDTNPVPSSYWLPAGLAGRSLPVLCAYLNFQRIIDSGSLEKKKEENRIKEPLGRVISKIVTNLQFSPKNQYRTGSFLTSYLFELGRLSINSKLILYRDTNWYYVSSFSFFKNWVFDTLVII
jgi:hypothetical protein